MGCDKCLLTTSDGKLSRVTASKLFRPVSKDIRTLTRDAVRKRMAKSPQWRAFYEGNGPEPSGNGR